MKSRALRWPEIDLDAKLITLSSARTKKWTGTSDSAGERSDGHPAKLQPSP